MINKLFIGFVVLFCFGCNQKQKTIDIIDKGNKEPLIKTYNFQEFESLFLNSEKQKIQVINFWATWCRPCVKELPYFEKLTNKHKDVDVILVSLDMNSQKDTKLLPFVKEYKLKSKVVHLNEPDANAWIPVVDKDWSGSIPATIFINKKEKKFYEQSFNYLQLTEVINMMKNDK